MDIYESLAHNTRIYRKRLHMSQEELAYRCGLARTQVGLIENGKNITLETLDKLAVGLNVSPMRLLVSFDVNGKPQLDYSERTNALDALVDKALDDGKNNEDGTGNKNAKVSNNNKNTKAADNNKPNNNSVKIADSDKSSKNNNPTNTHPPAKLNTKSTKDSSTDLKNCALVYWGGGSLEFQELSEESMDPSIKILDWLSILLPLAFGGNV